MTDPDPERASRDRAKPIRSFVVRAGRMGPGQARALATLAPRYVVPFRPTPIDFAALFGRVAPVVVEIGFGMGQATAAIAAARPDVDFLGIEVHPPGVGALLQQLDESALTNVRIVQHDAVEVLESMVAPASLAGVHVFFPDPWPKKRHHKRRLIQPAFVRLLASRLGGGGTLHCATDWAEYAAQMLEVLQADPGLRNRYDGYAPREAVGRPLTGYERRGLRDGRPIADLVFEKVGSAEQTGTIEKTEQTGNGDDAGR